jgi:transcriptional regulator with XRE-family HTH domain
MLYFPQRREKMNQVKIGQFIASSRKKKDMTQEQLAEKLKVSTNAVSKWERGINLPDASIMQELCSILNISLNELFAGETLKQNAVIKQSEKNILSLLELNSDKRKKNKLLCISLIIVILISLIITCRMILIKKGYIMDDNLKYSQVYISGNNNVKGNVDIDKFGKISIDFDIGANKYGYAVFKNPYKALTRLKKDYAIGLKAIQREYNLLPLNMFNFREYGIYGWQLTNGTDEEKSQANFITSFFDVYENSFN